MGDLTTLAVLKTAAPRLVSLGDSELSRLIAEASGIICDYTRRQFSTATTYVETLDPDQRGSFFLANRPVLSITSVSTGADYANPVDIANLQFNGATGEVRAGWSGGYFPSDYAWGWSPGCGWMMARIAYTAGYASVPPAVEGRCIAIVNRCAGALAKDPSVRSKTFGDDSYTNADLSTFLTLTEDDRRVLSRYKVW